MKKAQVIGISIAGIAGLGAFLLMQGIVDQPAKEIAVQVNATEVLVAAGPITLGTTTNEGLFRWQTWPSEAVSSSYITRSSSADVLASLNGAVARAPMLAGEPVTSDKLVKAGQGGVLAAILPAGMRAISTKITEATAVGRLILPNDHVDVILIRRVRTRGGQEEALSETLFRNIRVLAIGQQLQNKEGAHATESNGDTATLELTPKQAELLAQGNSVGEISLALRSIADIPKQDGGDTETSLDKKERGSTIRILRYGNRSQASSIN